MNRRAAEIDDGSNTRWSGPKCRHIGGHHRAGAKCGITSVTVCPQRQTARARFGNDTGASDIVGECRPLRDVVGTIESQRAVVCDAAASGKRTTGAAVADLQRAARIDGCWASVSIGPGQN